MGTIPDRKNEQIQFGEQHWPVWNVAPTTIGLSTSQVTAIKAAVTAARTSYDAALAARLASKAATTQSDNDIAAMYTLMTDAVKAIRLYAESTGNPNVYADAQIPPPAAPTPALPPTQPIELRGSIGPMGTLTIEWRAAAATPGFDASTAGVLYTIRRRLAGETNYTLVGTARSTRAGRRGYASFTDDTLPASPQGLQYIVQGVRSTGTGDLTGPASEAFNVTLGIGGDGVMTITETAPSVKLAA